MLDSGKQIKGFTLCASRVTAFANSKCLRAFGGSSLLRNTSDKQRIEENKTISENTSKQDETLSNMETGNDSQNVSLKREKKNVCGNGRKLSARSRSKLFNRCSAFISAQRTNKFPFLTLTFIGDVDDRKAVKILNKFLTSIRKQIPNFNYIWVAERQKMNNGRIHFHLILDHFIDVQKFNKLWVLQQYNEGVTHPNYSVDEIIKRYVSNTIKNILNPLDVRWAKGVGGVAAYLTKYVTKNDGTFNCLCWHCSRDVSKLCISQQVEANVFEEAGQIEKNSFVNKNTGEIYEPKDFETEYFIVRNILNKEYFSKYLIELKMVNRWILDGRDKDKIPNVKNKEFILFHLLD